MGTLLERMELAESAGKNEIRRDRKLSNGNCANFLIFHRFENGEVERCNECNRKDRIVTNEEQ
jgi:hypothetical protein